MPESSLALCACDAFKDARKRGDGRGGAPYKTWLTKDKKGFAMGAAWIGVIMIAVFIGVFAALNILEKGSLD